MKRISCRCLQLPPAPAARLCRLQPSSPAAAATERPYLLERVDDAAVVQLYADGFDELPLREKTLVWHLYQAAIAGRDIFYDQRYAHNLEMRDVLEAIVTHGDGVDPATLAEIQRYTKLFWINTGPYNNLTARKFVADVHAGGVRRRRARGRAGPARAFPMRDGETLDAAARAAAADVLRRRRSIRWSRPRRRRRARTSSPRAPTICTSA